MNESLTPFQRVRAELARLGCLRSIAEPEAADERFFVTPLVGYDVPAVELDGGWFWGNYDAAKLAEILATLKPLKSEKRDPMHGRLIVHETEPEFWGAVRPAELPDLSAEAAESR